MTKIINRLLELLYCFLFGHQWKYYSESEEKLRQLKIQKLFCDLYCTDRKCLNCGKEQTLVEDYFGDLDSRFTWKNK
mgnify:CR=1 FL=1